MKLQKFLLNKSSWISILLLIFSCCCFFLFNHQAALAHTPHDDIETLAVSPNYKEDKTLFVIVRQNLLKSSDGGANWQRMTQGIDNHYLLKSIAISPQNSQVIYLSSLGDGIYYSQNQGSSWTKVNNNLESLEINLVSAVTNDLVLATGYHKNLYKTINRGKSWTKVIDNPLKITAITSRIIEDDIFLIVGDEQGNMYISEDQGNNWQKTPGLLPKNYIQTLTISPNFPKDKTFLVGTREGGIFKTVDGGLSFKSINQGLTDQKIMSLQFSPNYPTDPQIFASSWKQGFFVSIDEGNTWTLSNQGLTRDGQANRKQCPKPVICPRPHFSDLQLANFDSEKPTLFLAGFDGLFTSSNEGKSWQQIQTLLPRLIVDLDISPDYVKDGTLAFTTYIGGISLSKDNGKEWIDINSGLENSTIYINFKNQINRLFNIKFSPNYSVDKTLFTSSWNQFFISRNGGKKWQKSNPLPWENPVEMKGIFIIAISPNFAGDNIVYIGNRLGEIFKSTDRGFNFESVGQIGEWIYSLVISPNYPIDHTLYASSSRGIYKTIDEGKTWNFVSQTISFPEPSDVSLTNEIQLVISPNYRLDQTVFAGTAYGLFVTENGGKNWRKLSQDAEEKNSYIGAIAISPDYQNDQTLIISVKGKGLFKTTDGGKTFTPIQDLVINNNNSLLNAQGLLSTSSPIKFSPGYAQDKTLYGYSWTKLFKSTDGGLSWQNLPLPESAHKSSFSYWYFRHNISSLLDFSSKRFKVIVLFISAFVGYLGYLLFRYIKRNKLLPL